MKFMNKDPRYAAHKIGRFTYGDPKIEDRHHHIGATLQIGSFCSIARGVTIWLGGNHHTEWVSTAPLNNIFGYDNGKDRLQYEQIGTDGGVTIGNDVWICSEAVILSGVTIGDGAVIGTRAVVSSDIPPYCVSVGSPARVAKKRFSDSQIQKLLEIRWWELPDEVIKDNIPLILSPNIDEFINKFWKSK